MAQMIEEAADGETRKAVHEAFVVAVPRA